MSVQNPEIAKQMKKFFRRAAPRRGGIDELHPASIAREYGMFFTNTWGRKPWRPPEGGERYSVHVASRQGDLAALTKRVTLISDTLLMSHTPAAGLHEIGRKGYAPAGETDNLDEAISFTIGMHCPDLGSLGRWIRDAEGLLRMGLVAYLPTVSDMEIYDGERIEPRPTRSSAVDYLLRDGRLVEVSQARPEMNRMVRPIAAMDLPFIEGVALADFSKITEGEFNSFRGFRTFLRREFNALDEAVDAEQMDRALRDVGFQIEEGVRELETTMRMLSRQRAFATTGAVVAGVTVVLAAVYGAVFKEYVTGLVGGAGGGTLGWAQAMLADKSKAPVEDNKWYYVWCLQEKSERRL
ncbi:hypothetical protein AB0O76_17280 [Streptomyces sp. NPDC086554]|uniref:hypothetical protein n=1 Tax=Streptomyces sp. NPDC086554 TaxID=3154864 RepID=UPI00343E5165